MNTKVLIGLVIIGLLAIAGVAFSLRSVLSSAPTTADQAATSTPSDTASKSGEPKFTFGTSTVKTSPATATFDAVSFTSTSTYPSISGTAKNTSKVGIIINNDKNIGVIGTWEVPVVNGHWSYSSSVALSSGIYTVILFAGTTAAGNAKLIVAH